LGNINDEDNLLQVLNFLNCEISAIQQYLTSLGNNQKDLLIVKRLRHLQSKRIQTIRRLPEVKSPQMKSESLDELPILEKLQTKPVEQERSLDRMKISQLMNPDVD